MGANLPATVCGEVTGFNPRTRDGCETVNHLKAVLVFGFNPRTRDGCENGHGQRRSVGHVSIHAPVMGANRTKLKLNLTRQSFNPRTRDGCENPSD